MPVHRGEDGAFPQAGLVDGTTIAGGLYANGIGGQYGEGTVFSVTRTGQEGVLQSFTNGPIFSEPIDGNGPSAGLLDVNGVLYGTTQFGDTN